MATLDRTITRVCHLLLWLATAVIFTILVGNTVLRYATGSSLQWANEVPELLFPWLVMAGVVLAAQQGAHITTTFFLESLPAPARRWVAVFGWSVVAALYLTLAWASWNLLPIVHDEKSPILQVPGSITYACVMGGLLMLALLALQSAWAAFGSAPVQPSGDAGTAATPSAPKAHW